MALVTQVFLKTLLIHWRHCWVIEDTAEPLMTMLISEDAAESLKTLLSHWIHCWVIEDTTESLKTLLSPLYKLEEALIVSYWTIKANPAWGNFFTQDFSGKNLIVGLTLGKSFNSVEILKPLSQFWIWISWGLWSHMKKRLSVWNSTGVLGETLDAKKSRYMQD